MRTTLDVPDELFKHAKLTAVHEGVPLKAVIARALQRGFAVAGAAPPKAVKARTAPNRASRPKRFRTHGPPSGRCWRKDGRRRRRSSRSAIATRTIKGFWRPFVPTSSVVDGGALLALLDPREEHHAWASQTFSRLPRP